MEDVTDLVRWGILATGHIASVFARDLALLSSEARLLAVGSRSLDKAMAFAADHGIPRAYESYADLAGDPDVDVVYVATPWNWHAPMAIRAMERGKHAFVEVSAIVTIEQAWASSTPANAPGVTASCWRIAATARTSCSCSISRARVCSVN